jgi:O-antigen/teichoic acid export membrane protein
MTDKVTLEGRGPIRILSINRPQVMTWISIAQLAATLVSHYLLISLLGAMGAALSTVVMWFIAGAVSMRYIYTHRFAIDDGVRR